MWLNCLEVSLPNVCALRPAGICPSHSGRQGRTREGRRLARREGLLGACIGVFLYRISILLHTLIKEPIYLGNQSTLVVSLVIITLSLNRTFKQTSSVTDSTEL